MSKRKAAAISPPLGQPENEGGTRRSARLATAAARRDEQPVEAAAAAATRPPATATATTTAAAASAPSVHQPTAVADSSAGGGAAVRAASSSSSPSPPSPFRRLAPVELQLVMHFCDRRSLIALALCSRSTYAAAAHPFAWRSLPLRLHCSRPSEISAWRSMHSAASLQLRHADLTLHWTLESAAAATAEEVAAALAPPRLRSLEIDVVSDDGRWGEESVLGESTSIVLVNALRSQLDGRRPSPNFTLSLSLRYQNVGAVGAAAIIDLVGRNQSLTRLDLKGNDAIQSDALIALAAAAGNSSSLRSLNLSYCGKLDAAAAAALARALTQSHSLTELELCGCRMDAASAKALSPGVKASSLQRLDLDSVRAERDNELGQEGSAALAAAVAGSQSLAELRLGCCGIDGDGAVALATALQQCSSMSLRRLHLLGNSPGRAGMTALCRMLSADQCKLTSVDLTYNDIGDADMTALAESLQFNTSLTELRLPNFPHLDAFIAHLAVVLQRSGGRSVLCALDWRESAIGLSDVTSLINLLRGNNAIEQLGIGQSSLSVADIAALAPAIGVSRLTHLNFCTNSTLGDAGLAALVSGLCACPGLHQLILWDCGLTPTSAADLARIVQGCCALEWLKVGANKTGDDGSCAILAALHARSSLRSLFLSDDDLGTRSVAALAEAFNRGWNPTQIDLNPEGDIDESVLALAATLEQRGPSLRLEWMRMWHHDLSVDAGVSLVRAVHRIPIMRILDLWLNFKRDDHAALSSVRAACSERPEVAVCLLEASTPVDPDEEGQ